MWIDEVFGHTSVQMGFTLFFLFFFLQRRGIYVNCSISALQWSKCPTPAYENLSKMYIVLL